MSGHGLVPLGEGFLFQGASSFLRIAGVIRTPLHVAEAVMESTGSEYFFIGR